MKRIILALAVLALFSSSLIGQARAGSIFLTGHDPDFHALEGGNGTGAQHINQRAIDFVTDPSFNSFAASGITKFLFVESSISPPSGHVDGELGIIASGYTPGVNFDKADASTLNAALNLLGQPGGYDALVIGSDFGGILTQAELDILDSRSADIINFLNNGGGLYAMAESGPPFGLTTGGQFGYLPFVVTSAALNQTEIGNTLTLFGTSLGLTNSDINGNASHNIFNGTFGLNPVDMDPAGDILSLAGRGQVNNGGVGAVPEPSTLTLLGIGAVCSLGYGWRRRKLVHS